MRGHTKLIKKAARGVGDKQSLPGLPYTHIATHRANIHEALQLSIRSTRRRKHDKDPLVFLVKAAHYATDGQAATHTLLERTGVVDMIDHTAYTQFEVGRGLATNITAIVLMPQMK